MTSAAAIGRGWWALAIVAGVGCGPGQGAVKLVVSYAGPRDACLVIRVAPAGNSGKVEERRLDQLPHLATRTVGVIPTAGEGDAVAITIDVHQRGCEGQQVWTQQLAANAARPAALVEAGILVRDQDDDTWADGRGSFAGGQLPGTDCDDSRAEVHPGGTELCNGLDDDCNEVRDDGLPSRFFYVDLDLDGWGNAGSDAGQTACSQPPGYAADAGDCDDFREQVHPGAVESCNGVDDNCDSASDEDFGIGQECDAGSSCNARLQCSDAGTAVCVSPLPLLSWFADDDGDGHGRADGGPILSCQQPPGTIPNSDDCDDTNRFIHVGAREVCDGKDDDCDPSTLEQCSDGGLKGFTRFPMPTANAQWRAVAPFARGFAWVVGESSQIALRYFELPSGTPPPDGGLDGGADAGADGGLDGGEDAGAPALDAGLYDAGFGDGGFLNYSSRCVGNFKAAWAAASGRLYLGEGNKIARLDLDAGCVPGWFTVSPYSEVTGISGRVTPDGGVTLFATVLDGRTFRIADLGPGGSSSDRTWTPDAGPTALYTVAPLSRDRAFVGGQTFGSGFYFAQLEGEGSSAARVRPGGPVALPYVLASGALSSTRAYFAGHNNTMFTWDGQGYLPISGPGPATSHFVGLCAFGTDHVLAVDTSARVWRFTGTRLADGGTTAELWVDLMSATSAPLRALAATAPDDVWVVGDNNSVLHFGE